MFSSTFTSSPVFASICVWCVLINKCSFCCYWCPICSFQFIYAHPFHFFHFFHNKRPDCFLSKESQLDQPQFGLLLFQTPELNCTSCLNTILTYYQRQTCSTAIQLKGYFHRRKVTTLNVLQSPAHVWQNTSLQQENCQPVSELINPSDTDSGSHTHKSAHAGNSNKYLFTQSWWSSWEVESTLFLRKKNPESKKKYLI